MVLRVEGRLRLGVGSPRRRVTSSRKVFLVGQLGNFGPVFIPHHRGQRGDGHQGAVKVFRHFLPVGGVRPDSTAGEGTHGVRQEPDGLEVVVSHHPSR